MLFRSGVNAEDLYQPGKGYGFIIEKNRREQELLQIPELNSAFETWYWYQDKDISVIESDLNGCYLSSENKIKELEEESNQTFDGEDRFIPLIFKVNVPRQGNYKLTIGIKSEEMLEEVLIFSGRRRLFFKGNIEKDKLIEITTICNVCDIVPRGKERIYIDKTIDITIIAKNPRITSLLISEYSCPTLYVAGDSTVTDQSAEYPYSPGTSYGGWGQMLPIFFQDNIAISNHSHSGLTTESFRKEGHYAVIDQYSKPRDFIMFQFGHNDQKLEELKAQGGYRQNLLRYISECRIKGAYPLLVTPLARNSWKGNDGTYNDLLEEYAKVCVEIGELTETPVLDLHKCSMEFIKKLGLENCKEYFFPNDFTHNNDYGAYKMAYFITSEIIRVCSAYQNPGYHYLAKSIKNNYKAWCTEKIITLPCKPEKYSMIHNPNVGDELLSDISNVEKNATRADILDMLIKTARYFPTNVYNDMFSDVLGHEWYAGIVECAYQNGMIVEELVEENLLLPTKEVTKEEFYVFALNVYKSRKNLPNDVPCIYDEKCSIYARTFIRAAVQIGLLSEKKIENLSSIITKAEAISLCRAMKI